MHTVQDVALALETWAPPGTAQAYDNVGLQVGRPDRPVAAGLIGLDMTPALLQEALRLRVDLIITHHPLLFQPLRHLTSDGFVPSLALRLAEAGIALYSIHTNLDAAPAGVSFALAEQLGLAEVDFLAPLPEHEQAGMGALGTLPEAEPLSVFLQRVAQALDAPALRYTGALDQPVHTVAVCGGAGRDLIGPARAAGADVYVTADLSYHTFFDVLRPDGTPTMALVDAGHYETEQVTERLLQGYLSRHFPALTWHQTQTRTSPVFTFVRAGEK